MNEINEKKFNIENTDINIFEAIITYCQMINSLTEMQSDYERNSNDWLKLERKIVEIECSLFNDVLELDVEIVEIIFQQLPIIPMKWVRVQARKPRIWVRIPGMHRVQTFTATPEVAETSNISRKTRLFLALWRLKSSKVQIPKAL